MKINWNQFGAISKQELFRLYSEFRLINSDINILNEKYIESTSDGRRYFILQVIYSVN